MKKPLIVLTGPTAAGKTRLSISLAKAVNGEIISADSMQVYRNMGHWIGQDPSGRNAGDPASFGDILSPQEEFHIVKFQQLAREAMDQIYAKDRIPILVGGTGFYIQAVTRKLISPRLPRKTDTAGNWNFCMRKHGASYLHEMLRKVDEKSAMDIHENNVKRVIRALEFFHQNHTPISGTQ